VPSFEQIVGGDAEYGAMLTFVIAVAVFVATSLQMLIALIEMREAHRPALEVARVENELVQQAPRLSRRRWRKELRSWRDKETDRSLAYVDAVAFSWTLLVFASAAASFQAGLDLL